MNAVTFRRAFPMTSATSAQLMRVKAQCLFYAGAVTLQQKEDVERRAAQIIARDVMNASDRAKVRRLFASDRTLRA